MVKYQWFLVSSVVILAGCGSTVQPRTASAVCESVDVGPLYDSLAPVVTDAFDSDYPQNLIIDDVNESCAETCSELVADGSINIGDYQECVNACLSCSYAIIDEIYNQ